MLEPGGQLAAEERLARLVGYVAALRARGNAPATVLHRLEMLGLFPRAADPGTERPGLKLLLARLQAEAVPSRDKRSRLGPATICSCWAAG